MAVAMGHILPPLRGFEQVATVNSSLELTVGLSSKEMRTVTRAVTVPTAYERKAAESLMRTGLCATGSSQAAKHSGGCLSFRYANELK